MITEKQACQKALDENKNCEVIDCLERDDDFIVSVQPKNYNVSEEGPFLDGMYRVMKDSGELYVFNPLTDDKYIKEHLTFNLLGIDE